MARKILSVIGGFIGWLVIWFTAEKSLAATWPAFGIQQNAFEQALKTGDQFTAEPVMLVTHIVIGAVASVAAGAIAALAAGENSRAPLGVGRLLLIMGVVKAVMSWSYVPIWYHVCFTLILLPLAIIGGKLIRKAA